MPIYDYKALDPTGKLKKGVVESDSSRSARQKLKKQRLIVTEIRQRTTGGGKGKSSSSISFFNGVKLQDLALMTRQLASLIKANVPLAEGLNALIEQTEAATLKTVISKVTDDVNEGTSLAKAMIEHPKVFDTIYINMVEAGESSGTLGLVLVRLADLKEAQQRLRGKVMSSMTYPLLMAVAGLGMMIMIFVVVIPKMTQIFDSMNKEIPATTQALMTFSGLLIDYWFLIIAGFVGSFWFFKRWVATQGGRRAFDALKLKIVLFGPLIRMVAITRFATTMSTLLGSGVPIISAMNIAKNLVGNVMIAEAIDNARDNITEGQSIAEPLKRSGQFPPMVIHMIAIGEKTGELPEMLMNVAETYEEQVDQKIQAMTALLEPVMMIGMGGVVFFIVMSVFMPLMEISNLN